MTAKIRKYCQFYADTPSGEVNEFFSFRVPGKKQAIACVNRFREKGFSIRVSYFVQKTGRKVDINQKL